MLNVKIFSEDRGTVDYIKAFDLQEMLNNNTPTEVINSGDSRDMFLLFVLHYARYAAPKEQLKEQMRKQVMNAGDSEKDNLHMCHLDLLTASDIAFALWQYFNSHDDWERKLNDPTKVYKHDTKWSTDKTGLSMTEGFKVYNELLNWCSKLKEMSKRDASEEDRECYKDLRVSCNKMAKKLGLVRVRDVPKMDVAEEIDLAEAREAAVAVFDFDEIAMI